MSTPFRSLPPSSTEKKKPAPPFFERLANVLAYVIAFPFIAAFIALKRVFTQQKHPAHSYYDNLPEQHLLGKNVGAGGEEGVASKTRSKKA